jgi:signal transduction histidine kinase
MPERFRYAEDLDRCVKAAGAAWGVLIGDGDAGFVVVSLDAPPALRHVLKFGDVEQALRKTDWFHAGYDLGRSARLWLAHTSKPSAAQNELALLAADALSQRLYAEELRQQNARLSSQLGLINQLGQRMTSIHDRKELFGHVTKVVHDALGYSHIQLLLANAERQTVELVHASGDFSKKLISQGFSEPIGGRGIIGWVARTGQIWASADVTRDPHFASHPLLPNTAAEVAVPLRIGERIIGVLDVQSDVADSFDKEDMFLLQTIADQIAPALEQNRLFAIVEGKRSLANTLAEVSRIVSSSLDPDQVLDMVLNQIERVVPHRGARITLLSDGDGMMRVVAAKGYGDNQKAKQSVFGIEDAPLTAPVLFEQKSIVIPDVQKDPRWIWQMGAGQVRSWCCAPLVIRDHCIGWLCVDWPEPNFYADEHAQIVRAFADQTAVAIENASLYKAVKLFNEHLEESVQQRTSELRLARDEIAAKADQLSALVRRVVQIQETERQRIAHDLHDGVTQSILAAIYELHAVRRRLEGADEVDRRVDDCQQLLNGALQEMKHIIYALRPRALDELGLVSALESFVSGIRDQRGIAIVFQVAGAAYHIPRDSELAIYRIVQEAFQNAIRHARASALTLTVTFRPETIKVSISDNGKGFDPFQVKEGLGLIGIRERAEAMKARLEIDTSAGSGTSIILELPRTVQKSKEADADPSLVG